MTYLLTFIILLIMMLALGCGLLFGKKGIQGGCSNLNQMDDSKGGCENCSCKNIFENKKGADYV